MEQTIAFQFRWSQPALIAFRFFFVYFVIYIFPFPLYYVPNSGFLLQPISELSNSIVIGLVGDSFGYPVVINSNGSGDTAFNYAQFFVFMPLSAIIAVIWSVLDRKRYQYEKLLFWLVILVSYYLAVTMLNYGFIKIFPTQFSFPTATKLNQTYGESSPMGLLWTFMGYSMTYNVFTGLGEAIGGFLLFFKRTRLLGAIVAVAVLSHVVVLNFSYDVPVKLHSMHLLSMAIFLIAPYTEKLLKFFLQQTQPEFPPVKFFSGNKRAPLVFRVLSLLFIAYLTVPIVMWSWSSLQEQKEHLSSMKDNRSFSGEFEVETFIMNGKEIHPDTLVTRRWKKLLISERSANIQSTDGATINWICHVSLHNKRMMLISPDLSTTGNFDLSELGDTLTLEGEFYQDNFKIIAHRKSNNPFLLVDRGFHWINEFPFNR